MDSDIEKSDLLAAQLIQEIVLAFTGTKRRGGISWREAEAIDNHASEAERQTARSLDADKTWQEVPDYLFDELPGAVSYLDGAGLRYYFPAFMVADIRRGGHWKSAVDDGFLDALTKPDCVEFLLQNLNDQQKRAIGRWLRLVHRRMPWNEPKALEVWGKFSPEANLAR